jgi:hypothetical protein
VLRPIYIGLMPRANRLWPAALAGSLLLAGCSMSVPILGSNDGPTTTGSITAPVEVQKPLPRTLAYSDAAKIGQAAAATLWQAEGGDGVDWVNAATGSSGTLAPRKPAEEPAGKQHCSDFDTLVTSIGGVHRYSGRVCRADGGRSILEIDTPEDALRP